MKPILSLFAAISCAFGLSSCEGLSGTVYSDYGSVTYDPATKTANIQVNADAFGQEVFNEK